MKPTPNNSLLPQKVEQSSTAIERIPPQQMAIVSTSSPSVTVATTRMDWRDNLWRIVGRALKNVGEGIEISIDEKYRASSLPKKK